jgi:hypothetical protein
LRFYIILWERKICHCSHLKYKPIVYWQMFSFSAALQPISGLGRLILWFLDHTQTHTRPKTPLNEWSARRRGRYLRNKQQTQETNIHVLRGFEPLIPAIKQLQTYALDCTATGIGRWQNSLSVLQIWRVLRWKLERRHLKKQGSSRKTIHETLNNVNAQTSASVPMLSSPISTCLNYATETTVNNFKKPSSLVHSHNNVHNADRKPIIIINT